MNMRQVAFYCQSDKAVDALKRSFGLENRDWFHDEVVCLSEVRGRKPFQSMYHVFINSDLGMELEIIRNLEGHIWLEGDLISVPEDVPVFSHVGFYLDQNEDFPKLTKQWKLVQETFTREHSNKSINFRFHYRVYDTLSRSYVKFIKRIV